VREFAFEEVDFDMVELEAELAIVDIVHIEVAGIVAVEVFEAAVVVDVESDKFEDIAQVSLKNSSADSRLKLVHAVVAVLEDLYTASPEANGVGDSPAEEDIAAEAQSMHEAY
jgi:hypothetical protein